MSDWGYIWLKLKYHFGKRKNDIDNLRYLIARDDMRISELSYEYSPPNHCCPSCASSEYRYLVAKNERRKEWLEVLLKRKGRVK